MKEMIETYQSKLERKERMLSRLQQKENDLSCELTTSETIQLSVLQAEVRLLREVIEDFSAC